jgi:rhodanese-related sulfurtransferase
VIRFLAILLLVLGWTAGAGAQAVTDVDAEGLEQLIARGVPVVDIRTAPEWHQSGSVPGAWRITAIDPQGRPVEDFAARLAKVAGPDREVALICRTGARSRAVSHMLAERHGYSRLYNVVGGFSRWAADGRPVER